MSSPHPRRNEGIKSLAFYLAGLKRLNAAQKIILGLVAECEERGPPFRPSLAKLAGLCSCSTKHCWRALNGLDGQHGWIIREWYGGQKTNSYRAGWRLKRILQRYRTQG